MVNKTVVTIVSIFLLTNLIGLYVALSFLEAIESGELEQPETKFSSFEDTFVLFGYILVGTAVIFISTRFWKPSLKVIEAFLIFISSWLTFDFLIPIYFGFFSVGLILAIALTAWKMLRPSITSQNIAAIFTGSGAGAVIGISFQVTPALIFLLVLCIYDFIAVFITKHMVSLAKIITQRPTVFTIASPHKFKKAKRTPLSGKRKRKTHVFQLGLGDVVMPMMFSISLLTRFSIVNSLFSMAGSAIALAIMIYYITEKPQVLPALPFISLGTLSGFLISVLL